MMRGGWAPRGAHLLLVLLMVCYVAGYAYSAPHTDTADEILRAYEIRHGLAFPVEGPFLGNAIHLGPAWFYLAAIPLWISHSWLAVVLLLGFIASLKFPLAYWCGRRLIDSSFGLWWAVAMFVPGWHSVEQMIVLNPNAVAAAALLVFAVFLKGLQERTTPGLFFAAGLAFAIAIHVHPTTMPAGFLLLWLLVVHRRRGGALGIAVAACAAGFVLPFAPYVVSQVANGFADWQSASSYASGQISLANVVNTPSVIVNYVTGGPQLISDYILHWGATESMALRIAFVALALTPLAALVKAPEVAPARRLVVPFLAALAVTAAWIACARPTTPVQFVWILCPLVAALTALGLWSLSRFRVARAAVLVVAAGMVVMNLVAIRGVAWAMRDGEGRVPLRVLDIKGSLPRVEVTATWFPAYAHGELGRLLCETPGSIDLHGPLAEVIDKDLGLDTLLQCRDRSRLSLAGDRGPTHYAGMTRPFWRALGWKPPCLIGSLGITRNVTPLGARVGLAIADGSTYLPRKPRTFEPREVTFTGTLAPGHALLATNVLGPYEVFRVVSAELGGATVAPVAGNDLARLFRAADQANAAAFRLVIATSNPGAVDVVSIAPPAGAATCRD